MVLDDENRTLSLNASDDTLYSDSKSIHRNIYFCRNGFTMNRHVIGHHLLC